MAAISASMVKELRQRTGMGMMECKKALVEVDGDLTKAEDLLRIKGGAKASKVAGRVAAEGAIGVFVSTDAKTGALIEVNCETDFVGKDANFIEFVNGLATMVAQTGVTDVGEIGKQKLSSGETVEETRLALVMKLGENITVRRAALHKAEGKLGHYLHGARIGVIVDVDGGDDALGKDLAMHIAA